MKAEASKVEGEVEKFHDKFPDSIRILDKSLSFQPFIDKLEQDYTNVWENQKTILTQAGRKCMLSSKFEEFKSALQNEIRLLEIVLKDLSVEEDYPSAHNVQENLGKSDIAKLRESALSFHELDTKGEIFDMFSKYDNLHEKCCVKLTAKKEFEAILVEMSFKLAEMKRTLLEWQKQNDYHVADEISKMQALLKNQQSEWIIKLCRLSQTIHGTQDGHIPIKLQKLQDEYSIINKSLSDLHEKLTRVEAPPRPPLPAMTKVLSKPAFYVPLRNQVIN